MNLSWYEPASSLLSDLLTLCLALLTVLEGAQWVLLTPLFCLAVHKLCIALYARYSCEHVKIPLGGQLSTLDFGTSTPKSTVPTTMPNVTVQLPIFNEPAVVLRLLQAAVHLEYPRELLEIQVLDDSSDHTVSLIDAFIAALPEDAPKVVVIRRAERTGFKGGALQAGLLQARGEFLAVFDADFVPPPDFLIRILPHFEDPAVGVVQGRWGFLNADQNLLTRAEAALLCIHFGLEQAGRSAAGLFLNFNGSAGVWRRTAIEDAGGWSADTLTEDLDLSYRAQLNGWRFRYVDSVVVPSELPADMESFCSQQRRWTVGAAQVFRKCIGLVWCSQLPFVVRLDATLHLLQNAAFPFLILSLAVSVLHAGLIFLGAALVQPLPLTGGLLLYGAGMVVYLATMLLAPLPHCRSFLSRLRGIGLGWVVAVGMSLHNSAAFLEGLWGTSLPFVRTPKSGGLLVPTKSASVTMRSATGECVLVGILLSAVCASVSSGAHGSALLLSLFAASFLFLGIAKSGAVRL